MREAEYGDWDTNLPGGSMWLAAAAAVEIDSGQLGGDGVTEGCHACSAVVVQGWQTDSDSTRESCGLMVDAEVDDRRATDGGHAGLGSTESLRSMLARMRWVCVS
eukprot:SAG11_NODE_9745_length_883_cov_2.014031_2_plen_105_part_00